MRASPECNPRNATQPYDCKYGYFGEKRFQNGKPLVVGTTFKEDLVQRERVQKSASAYRKSWPKAEQQSDGRVAISWYDRCTQTSVSCLRASSMTIRAVKHGSYQPYPVESNDEFLSPSRPDVASCSITLIRRLLLATFSGYDTEELR